MQRFGSVQSEIAHPEITDARFIGHVLYSACIVCTVLEKRNENNTPT